MGRQWYENGKLLKKKNTFTDFIACAEYLIANKYCSKERLCINGRSAGGLLIGTVLNMRPDLFKVAIAGVPFVDVLTTMLDPTIPLTTAEWEVNFSFLKGFLFSVPCRVFLFSSACSSFIKFKVRRCPKIRNAIMRSIQASMSEVLHYYSSVVHLDTSGHKC